MHRTIDTAALASRLLLVRHGATEPNLAGLRCGGDLDVPLTELGREQAANAAHRILGLDVPVGVIVASDLQRTRETATIISRVLGGVAIRIEPAFSERRLGAWNRQPVAETEAALAAGVTPPGGESDAAFVERIAEATSAVLLPLEGRSPLLVGSKGVARVLRQLLGLPRGEGLMNGELLSLNLAPMARLERAGCHA